jgi:hypothetical protein
VEDNTSGLRFANFKTLLSLSLTNTFRHKNSARGENVKVELGVSQPWVLKYLTEFSKEPKCFGIQLKL